MLKPEKPWKAEYARTGRSKCMTCYYSIPQDLLRLGIIAPASYFDGLAPEWHHADCIFKKEGQIESVDDVEGMDLLSLEDQEKIKSYINPDEQQGFLARVLSLIYRRAPIRKKADQPAADSISAALQEKLEEQNKAVWRIKDELKEHVETKELRAMLKANKQYTRGSENILRDCCADGMLFGALDACGKCHRYSLRYVGEKYRCHGTASGTRCSYSTRDPSRLQEKWRIPPGTTNKYLLDWFDSQEAQKPARVLPPPSAVYDEESLRNLKVVIAGKPMDEIDGLKKKLMAAGVKFYANIRKDTSCLVWHGEMDDDNSEIKSARGLRIPIVHLAYLQECLLIQKKLRFGPYIVDATWPYTQMVPVALKDVLVHKDSALQDTGHILTDKEYIYHTALIKSDLAAGGNSYYILQIIQEGDDPDCHLFRKWGRIGYDAIGDSMKEKMPMSNAIEQFKELFRKKTGNTWESWEPNVDEFNEGEGKYVPVNIDYFVGYVPALQLEGGSSELHPKVKELMQLICKEQIFRANSMKADINMDELPLGKLSIFRINKGLKILEEIYDLLWSTDVADPTISKSILDLSNNYYNVIPSIDPRPISDKEDLRAKREMLLDLRYTEALMETSGISMEIDSSVDENYKKLRYEVKHLPQDSDDYKLVEKYFSNSKSPFHNEWDLDLEEVFEINGKEEREEHESSNGDTLRNKMLLWHGDRLGSVLWILSQGLTITSKAEKPIRDSFGTGLYFADLVSKSAQLCFVKDTSAFNPKKKEGYGILFLAEVALGDVYELTQYQNIKELPEGKQSVKGVGWVKPSEEHVIWRHQVKVPCGRKPTLSRLQTDLKCNEYVVHDTTQVKLRFLVKVRFRSKETIVPVWHLHNIWTYMRNGLVRNS